MVKIPVSTVGLEHSRKYKALSSDGKRAGDKKRNIDRKHNDDRGFLQENEFCNNQCSRSPVF
jgi:hypothetical protein